MEVSKFQRTTIVDHDFKNQKQDNINIIPKQAASLLDYQN